MGDLFSLTEKLMQRIEPYFRLSHGVDEGRIGPVCSSACSVG